MEKFTCAGDRCALVTVILLIKGRYIPCPETGSVAIFPEVRRKASAEKAAELCMTRAPSKSATEASCGKICVTYLAKCPLGGKTMYCVPTTNPALFNSCRLIVLDAACELAKATPSSASPDCVFRYITPPLSGVASRTPASETRVEPLKG